MIRKDIKLEFNFDLKLDYQILTAIFYILGLLCAILSLWRTRTPQGTAAWFIGLISFPFIAVPLFLIFGRNKFYRTSIKKSKLDERARTAVAGINQVRALEVEPPPLIHPFTVIAKRANQVGFTDGNSLQLLINAQDAYAAMLGEISKAQKYILFQFYIFRSDATGASFKDALIAKAKAGVRVYFLYDRIGGRLGWKMYKELSQAGVHVEDFRSMQFMLSRFQVNFRNHRKVVVIDGETAFVGGLNIGNEYLGKHKKLSPWRDTHVQCKGPSALAAQISFLEDWFWSSEKIINLDWLAKKQQQDAKVLVLHSGPVDDGESCLHTFLTLIHSAKKNLCITAPYFIPPEGISNALTQAVLRGVEVKILVPGITDNMLVRNASKMYISKLQENGIEFFRYKQGFLHEKVMLVDDQFAFVGSPNLDSRSLFINFEIMAISDDQQFVQAVAKMLEQDLSNSKKIPKGFYKKQNIFIRILARLTALLSPML